MNATDDKVAYMRDYRKRYRETPEGKAKLLENRKRWKSSELGKQRAREYAKDKYVPRPPRKRLPPDEAARRKKESQLKTISRPGYKEKRRLTAYWAHIARTYGLSPEDYLAMAVNGCNICGEPDKPEKRLHVDHCHSTGKVRGLLCDPCNRGLGCFRDNTLKLEKALSYLRGG